MSGLSYGSRIERNERGIPVTRVAASNERYGRLADAVDRLRSAGVPLWAPVEIREWNGDARYGRFVHIDATTCALHVGRGSYIALDIQRDLNGVTPSEATNSMLCRSGTVRRPDAARSHNVY